MDWILLSQFDVSPTSSGESINKEDADANSPLFEFPSLRANEFGRVIRFWCRFLNEAGAVLNSFCLLFCFKTEKVGGVIGANRRLRRLAPPRRPLPKEWIAYIELTLNTACYSRCTSMPHQHLHHISSIGRFDVNKEDAFLIPFKVKIELMSRG